MLSVEILDIIIKACEDIKAALRPSNEPTRPHSPKMWSYIPLDQFTPPSSDNRANNPAGRTPVAMGGQMNHCLNCGALGRRRLNGSNYCKQCKPHDADFLESVLEALS